MAVQQHQLEDVEDLIQDLTIEMGNRSAGLKIFMLATILMFLEHGGERLACEAASAKTGG